MCVFSSFSEFSSVYWPPSGPLPPTSWMRWNPSPSSVQSVRTTLTAVTRTGDLESRDLICIDVLIAETGVAPALGHHDIITTRFYGDDSFEGEDGTKVDESGNQKRVGPKAEDIGTISSGSYSYLSPDGTPISVVWTSNENGFVATGDHLPTPPPMPQHVVKMLDSHLEKWMSLEKLNHTNTQSW